MTNIVKFYPANAADNPDNVLEQAIGETEDVLVLGWDKDGDLFAAASSGVSEVGRLLWLIERFKAAVVDGACVE